MRSQTRGQSVHGRGTGRERSDTKEHSPQSTLERHSKKTPIEWVAWRLRLSVNCTQGKLKCHGNREYTFKSVKSDTIRVGCGRTSRYSVRWKLSQSQSLHGKIYLSPMKGTEHCNVLLRSRASLQHRQWIYEQHLCTGLAKDNPRGRS